MSRPIATALCAVAASLAAASAHADDSTAGLTQGGIELKRSDGIEMRREDLHISPKAIRVWFRFRNVTGKDIDTVVAFSMPDIEPEWLNRWTTVPSTDPVNFMGFKTWVDGKPVTARIEQKAMVDGVDHSALLRRIGVPLLPFVNARQDGIWKDKGSTAEILENLPRAQQDELLRLKLIKRVQWVDQPWLIPAWTLKTTYYWRQVFPAGRDLGIYHRYKPSLGGYLSDDVRDEVKGFCPSAALLARLERNAGGDSAGYGYAADTLDYVLKSGANWRGPIGDFRLVIETDEAKDLVSFCIDGPVRQISPTQYEWRRRNFLPKEDLSILFLGGY
jgi:hypothetical protein